MFSLVKTNFPLIAIEHDNRHRLSDDAFARESLAYILQIPEKGINGFIYTWVNGISKAGCAVLMFGPGVGSEPVFERIDNIPVSNEADFYKWQVGGLNLALGKPFQSVNLEYFGDRISMTYNFEAMAPPYPYSSSVHGCPQWMAKDRFEQHGRANGTMTIDGKTFDYACFSQRDHSWGTRDWGINHHWKWIHFQTSDMCMHVWHLMALGSVKTYGFLLIDGEMKQIRDAQFDFSCQEGLTPENIQIRITDTANRSISLDCDIPFGTFPFKTHELSTLYECPLASTYNGESGSGWLEMMWTNDMISYMKNRTVTQ